MAPSTWLALGLSILLFVIAAKTHGRQIRLERERRGYLHIQFGTGTNPPWVEGLWRRDRIRFWSLSLALVTTAIILALVLPPHVVPFDEPSDRARLVTGLFGALLWAPTLSFLTLASLSLRRLWRDAQPAQQTLDWHRSAARGSLLWFGASAALAAAILALLLT